jgi:phosphopantothenate---cysteine ligase (CTP)
MKCLVTSGPTYEPLDEVRRLTNSSTGTLGSGLANFLVERGHEVTLLIGATAAYHGPQAAQNRETFTTTADLGERLQHRAGPTFQSVFHAAAVSDFTFGRTWRRADDGARVEIQSAKLTTREGVLLAELTPTPKLIARLRAWFPHARLIGWKYEVAGTRQEALARAEEQLRANATNACVLNGPAYGTGFGLVTGRGRCAELADAPALYKALATFIEA